MAISVTSNMTDRDDATTAANWLTRNEIGALGASTAITTADEEVPPIEGTTCIGWDCDVETGAKVIDLTSVDLSATHVEVWGFALTAAQLEVLAPGAGFPGVYIHMEDTSGNMGYWYVAGSDTYVGGWRNFIAYGGNTPDANNGTNPTMSVIRYIGLGFESLAKSKAAHNMFVDICRTATVGQGLLVTTSAASVATWTDLVTADVHFGQVEKEGAPIVLRGGITFGTSALDCELADSEQLIVFAPEEHIGAGHYVLKLVGGAATTTNFTDGTKTAGGAGIRGSIIKAGVGMSYDIDFDDTNIDNIKFYGTQFFDSGDQLYANSVSGVHEMIDCVFTGCGEVYSENGTWTRPRFIDSPGRALRIDETSHVVTAASFTACDVGVHFPIAGTYSLVDFVFAGSVTADVENSATATNEDQYASSNQDGYVNLDATNNGFAQSFTVGGAAAEASSIMLFLQKQGSPTGNFTVGLYANSGGLPTGTALGEVTVAASTVPATGAEVDFSLNNSAQVQLTASTIYHVVIKYSAGDGTNYIQVGTDSSTPTHAGTASVLNGSWAADATQDMIFEVNKDGIVQINSTDSNPSTITNTGTIPGAVVIVNTKTLKVTVKDVAGVVVQNARVAIYASETAGGVTEGDELIDGDGGALTNASGIVQNTGFNYLSDVNVSVRVRKSSTGDTPRYKPLNSPQLITSSGLDVIVTLIEDTVVAA